MSKLEIDKKCIANAKTGLVELCASICNQLDSKDEFKMQMGWNAASSLIKFMNMISDFYSPYIKTGIDLAENEDVNAPDDMPKIKPHPIYVWDEEEEQESDPSKRKMPDALKRLLREILEDE